MTLPGWQPLAELFAAKLPEFDAVYAVAGAEPIAGEVAHARGVPDLTGQVRQGSGGKLVIFTSHLQSGVAEEQACLQARQAGWDVPLVAAAVERTNQGARAKLEELGIKVRAAVQIADTPHGLVFERRSPERWAS